MCLFVKMDKDLFVHDTLWHFSVTDPRLHTKGFTVYKVTCKSFHIESHEVITEMVCWKRYNDIKMLYKSLKTLYKAQQRPDPFPEFARPILFGRFTESVIENRRQSAVDLLNFISTQPHLYKSTLFKEFLEEGRVQSDFNKKGSLLSSRSSHLNVITSNLKVNVKSGSDNGRKVANHRQIKVNENASCVDSLENEHKETTAKLLQGKTDFKRNKTEKTLLEGTWKFPQVADNISLGSSSEDETVDTDDEFVLEGSLPDADMACFSSISPEYYKSAVDGVTRRISRNTRWLLEGLNICADMDSSSDFLQGKVESNSNNKYAKEESRSVFNESTLNTESSISKVSKSTISFSALEYYQANLSTISKNTPESTVSEISDLGEDDSIRRMSQSSGSSKAECGRGDLDLSVELQTRSSSFGSGVLTSSRRSQSTSSSYAKDKPHSDPSYVGTLSSSQTVRLDSSLESLDKKNPQKYTGNFLKSLVSGNPILSKPRSMTEQSISTMSIGGSEDYIYQAANQISKAQNREANGDYEMAFAYYKSGVGILLHGVQGDTNKFRRDAVRRKTAKYLMKAEDLFNRYLANEKAGELRWGAENFLSPSLDPSFAFIRGSAKELRNFQVLATMGRVILVRHKVTDETFVIKSISKSSLDTGSTQSVLPTTCPYMVSLHRFYETEDSVFLLLEYASGGKLWTYIENYLNSARSSVPKLDLENNIIKTVLKPISFEVKSKTSNREDNTERDNNSLNGVLKEEKDISYSDFNYNSEGSVPLENSDALRTSTVYKEASDPCIMNDLLINSSHSESFEVDKKIHRSCDFNILNFSDFTDDIACSHRTQPLDRTLSSLSDDCPAVGEQESSIISPITLPEDSFQNLLLENKIDCEAFSIISVNSEDTNHSFSFCENVCGISTNPDCNNWPEYSALNQIRTYETLPVAKETEHSVIGQEHQHPNDDFSSDSVSKCDSSFSSEDLIRKSKELLTHVDKVLAGSSNRTKNIGNTLYENNSQLKPFFLTSYAQGHIKCEDNSSSVGEALSENNEKNFDNAFPDKLSWFYSSQNDLDTSEFVNGSNTSAGETCQNVDFWEHSSSSARETKHVVLNAVTENKSVKNYTVFIPNNATHFGQVNAPRKLSTNHTNYKGIMRSASFECDFRSPARNRTTTASYLSEHLNSTSLAPTEIPESFIKRWIAQMVTAVSRLHSLGVVCRDLKPSNILLGDGGQVYLTYFCKLAYDDQELDWEAKENLYAAPEVGSVNRYDRSCDWWSIGALLYELVVGKSLVECHPGGINSHTCLHIPMFVSSETRGLLEGLLRHNPNERLGSGIAGSEEIKAHPFFTGVDWRALEYS